MYSVVCTKGDVYYTCKYLTNITFMCIDETLLVFNLTFTLSLQIKISYPMGTHITRWFLCSHLRTSANLPDERIVLAFLKSRYYYVSEHKYILFCSFLLLA